MKRELEKALESTGTRFLLGHDFRDSMLHALSPSPKRNDNGLAIFSIVANEMFFLPAWLDHHRGLGVQHFYILVDRSEDGTLEFLRSQNDVTTMSSGFGYASMINISPLSKLGHERFTRAGPLYKRVVTEKIFEGQWGLCLDVDEFLMIPPSFENIQELIDSVDGRTTSIPASNLVFFPRRISEIIPQDPKSLGDLFRQAPYFDAEPLIRFRKGNWPALVGQDKTAKLLEKFLAEESATIFKTPLMKHSRKNYRMGAHISSAYPATEHILAVAHFVFTANTVSKIERAKTWNSYYNQSASYRRLGQLIELLSRHDYPLLGPSSTRYVSNSQLLRAGLINWPSS